MAKLLIWIQHLGRSLDHIGEMKEQEPCWCGEKPLALHHRGGCQCQCTARERDVSAAVCKDMKMIDQISYNLKDGQDNVIDVAEATGLPLLGMVKSSRPVDGHLN